MVIARFHLVRGGDSGRAFCSPCQNTPTGSYEGNEDQYLNNQSCKSGTKIPCKNPGATKTTRLLYSTTAVHSESALGLRTGINARKRSQYLRNTQ